MVGLCVVDVEVADGVAVGGVGGDPVAVADEGDGGVFVVASDVDAGVLAEVGCAAVVGGEGVDGGVGLDGEPAGAAVSGAAGQQGVVPGLLGVRRPIALCRRWVL